MKKVLIFVFFLLSSSISFAEEKLLFQSNKYLNYYDIINIYPKIKNFNSILYLKDEDCHVIIEKIKDVYYVYFFNSCFCGSGGCLLEIYKNDKVLFSKLVGGYIKLDGNKIVLPDLKQEFIIKEIK